MDTVADTSAAGAGASRESTSYSIFMLVLTVMSLIIMVLLLLPLGTATLDILRFYDNLICVVFLVDFAVQLRWSRPKRDYFVTRRGWLDLLGSIPSFGFFPVSGLLRLARVSRLARVTRLLRENTRGDLVGDVLENRGRYALLVTGLSALLVLVVSSVLVVQVESEAADANITTGADGLWWSLVTITTVGYGDQYPVSALGRIVAVFVMFAGVGIIGSLASILASVLVPQSEPSPDPPADPATDPAVGEALDSLKAELAALRQALADRDTG